MPRVEDFAKALQLEDFIQFIHSKNVCDTYVEVIDKFKDFFYIFFFIEKCF